MIATRFPASDVVRNTSKVFHKAAQAPIAITKHGDDQFVIMSKDYFDMMISRRFDPRRAYTIDNLPDALADEMLTEIDRLLGEDE